MAPKIDVFVLGSETGSPYEFTDPKLPTSLQVIPTGAANLPEFASSRWADRIMEGDGDLVAIVADCSPESLRQACFLPIFFGHDPANAQAASLMIERIDRGLLVDHTSSVIPVLRDFRVLLAPRAAHGAVVFRRSKFDQIGPLRPVAEPVWDWVIRAAFAGFKVNSTAAPDDERTRFCRLPLLAPQRPTNESNWLLEHLTAFDSAKLGITPTSKVDEIALRAGLFQLHDFLNESHELSQSIEGQGANQLGDYWHAIMHRREPDYSNAKYWFRQIGNQATYRDLRQFADGILESCKAPDAPRWRQRLTAGPKWDPFAFVDMCEECASDETSDLAIAARRIQYAEMSLLM